MSVLVYAGKIVWVVLSMVAPVVAVILLYCLVFVLLIVSCREAFLHYFQS